MPNGLPQTPEEIARLEEMGRLAPATAQGLRLRAGEPVVEPEPASIEPVQGLEGTRDVTWLSPEEFGYQQQALELMLEDEKKKGMSEDEAALVRQEFFRHTGERRRPEPLPPGAPARQALSVAAQQELPPVPPPSTPGVTEIPATPIATVPQEEMVVTAAPTPEPRPVQTLTSPAATGAGMVSRIRGLPGQVQRGLAAPQKMSREAMASRQEAIEQQGELEESRALEFWGLSEERKARMSEIEEQQRITIKARADAEAAARLDVRKAREAIRKHPEIRDRRTLGQRIGAAIAVGLGQYAAGMVGGPNAALQIVNKAVDDDLAAQREELGKKKETAAYSINELDRLIRQHGSQEQGERLFRMEAYAEFERRAKEISAEYTGKVAQQRAMELSAAVQGEQAKLETEHVRLATAAAETAITREISWRDTASAIRARGMTVAGWQGQARHEKVYPEAIRYAADFESAIEAMDKLIGFRSKVGAWERLTPAGFYSKARSEWEPVWTKTVQVLKKMEGFGANFTQMEKDLLEMGVPSDVGKWGFVENTLRVYREAIKSQGLKRMKAFGFAPGPGTASELIGVPGEEIVDEDVETRTPISMRPGGGVTGLD
jgi:hypothetical protein